MLASKIRENLIVYIATAAGFFLIFRTGHSIKIADIILAALGAAVILDAQARNSIKAIWPRLRPYARLLSLLIFFIVVAQFVSYARGESIINFETLINYLRTTFNIYAFLIIALVIYCKRNALLAVSAAIVVSPIVVLPVYWNQAEGINTTGYRLMGTLQNPIIFGLWVAVVFLLGTGSFMATRKRWLKIVLAAWLLVIANFVVWAGSRAAWLALAAAFLLLLSFYLFKEKNYRKALMLSLLFLIEFSLGTVLLRWQFRAAPALLSYLGSRATNLVVSVATIHPQIATEQVQTAVWPLTSRFVIQHPLGFGFGDYARRKLNPKTNGTATADSFLELALYGGIGAVFCFLVLIWLLMKEGWRAANNLVRKFDFYDLKLAWLVVPAAVVVDIIFSDAFLLRHVWFVLGISLGVILVINDYIFRTKNSRAIT